MDVSGSRVKLALVDSDDVLVDCATVINKLLNAAGSEASVQDYKIYNFPHYHGLTNDDLKKLVDNDRSFLKMDLLPKASEAIELLRSSGFEIRLITSRGAFDDAEEQTLEFYNSKGIIFDSIDVVNPVINSKSDVYKKYLGSNVDAYLFDDSLSNLTDAEENGVVPVCISQPWNGSKGFYSIFDAVQSIIG